MTMQSDRNVNINIRDNRGVATLAGFVIVVILTRLWWTGLLSEMFSAAYSPRGEGMTSATYMVVSLIANLIYGIGTVAVMVWSGLWWLIADVVQAFRQYMAERAAKSQMTNEIATEQAYQVAAEPDAMVQLFETIDSNMQAIADRLDEIDARMSMAEEQLEAAAKPRTNTRSKG